MTGSPTAGRSAVLPRLAYLEGELTGPITEDELVTLHWDCDQSVDITALTGVLGDPRVIAWSRITITRNESHDGLWLRLTVTDPRVCRIKVHADVPPEVCDPIGGWRMALVDGDMLVYLTARWLEAGDEVCWELGAIGHGPAAVELTEYLCDEIRAWGPNGTHSGTATLSYCKRPSGNQEHPGQRRSRVSEPLVLMDRYQTAMSVPGGERRAQRGNIGAAGDGDDLVVLAAQVIGDDGPPTGGLLWPTRRTYQA